jgi:tRNA threonylcarbamoyladenosine dehydratase
MPDPFSRTRLLIGAEALARLEASTVAVLGLGGVGSYAAEALARSGVGSLILVDDDSVCVTNINRQLIASSSTVGRPKAEVMRERALDINPRIRIEAIQGFFGPESADGILRPGLSYIVDAIDTVSSKIDLVVRAKAAGIPIISSMGAGNKLDPTKVEIADISKTSICPLARVMRKELRKRGIERLDVVFSREIPLEAGEAEPGCPEDCHCPGKYRANARTVRRSSPGSVAFVTSAFGMAAASVVVRALATPPSRSPSASAR